MKPLHIHLPPTSKIPNSPLPLTLYPSAFPSTVSPTTIEHTFSSNNWTPQWRYPMYKQSHYHSNTHEALGVFRGAALLRFGGHDNSDQTETNTEGKEIDVKTGDVIIVPAGVSHMMLEEKEDGFCMVGAYPGSKSWDMQYSDERKDVGEERRRIFSEVGLPDSDPVLGVGKGVVEVWRGVVEEKGGKKDEL